MNDDRSDDLTAGRNAPPAEQAPMTPAQQVEEVRRRQRSRSLVLAVILGGFVVLVFAISIVKIQIGSGL